MFCNRSINFNVTNSCSPRSGGINRVIISSGVDRLDIETFPESSNFTTDYTFDVSTQQGINVSVITLNFALANSVNQSGIQNLKKQPLDLKVYLNDGTCRVFNGTSNSSKCWLTKLSSASGQKLEDSVTYTLEFTQRSISEPLIYEPALVSHVEMIPPEYGWPDFAAGKTAYIELTVQDYNTAIACEAEPTGPTASALYALPNPFDTPISSIGSAYYGSTALSVASYVIEGTRLRVTYGVLTKSKKSKK